MVWIRYETIPVFFSLLPRLPIFYTLDHMMYQIPEGQSNYGVLSFFSFALRLTAVSYQQRSRHPRYRRSVSQQTGNKLTQRQASHQSPFYVYSRVRRSLPAALRPCESLIPDSLRNCAVRFSPSFHPLQHRRSRWSTASKGFVILSLAAAPSRFC